LKLDFEKAFDKIEHEAMLQIMRKKGFGKKMAGLVEAYLFFWHLFCSTKWCSW